MPSTSPMPLLGNWSWMVASDSFCPATGDGGVFSSAGSAAKEDVAQAIETTNGRNEAWCDFIWQWVRRVVPVRWWVRVLARLRVQARRRRVEVRAIPPWEERGALLRGRAGRRQGGWSRWRWGRSRGNWRTLYGKFPAPR